MIYDFSETFLTYLRVFFFHLQLQYRECDYLNYFKHMI